MLPPLTWARLRRILSSYFGSPVSQVNVSSPTDSYQQRVHHWRINCCSAASESDAPGKRFTTSRSSSLSSDQLFIFPSPQRVQRLSSFTSKYSFRKGTPDGVRAFNLLVTNADCLCYSATPKSRLPVSKLTKIDCLRQRVNRVT